MEAPDGTTATANSFILGILWNDPVWRNKSAGTCQEIWHFPGNRSTMCGSETKSLNLKPAVLARFYMRKPLFCVLSHDNAPYSRRFVLDLFSTYWGVVITTSASHQTAR
jgi:hypothetical protein